MQVTPIMIPQVETLEELRRSVVLAINRMASQINRGAAEEAGGVGKFDLLAAARGIRNEIANTPIRGERVVPGTLDTATFASTIRPVSLVSTLPTLPDPDYPPGAMVYHISANILYRVDPAGTALQKAVTGQDMVANTITAGQIAAGAISTTELYAGEILVGSGGGKPTRFRVNDSGGNLVAFVGDDGAGFVGGYFTNLRVGPTFATPNITASGSGVSLSNTPLTITNGNLTVAINGTDAIKITHTSYTRFVEMSAAYVRAEKSTDNYNYAQIIPASLQLGYSSSLQGMQAYADASGGAAIFTNATGTTVINIRGANTPYIDVTGGSYKIDNTDVINSSKQFVGAGVSCTGYGIAASGFNPYASSTQYYGTTASQSVISSVSGSTGWLRVNSGTLEYSTDYSNWYTLAMTPFQVITAVNQASKTFDIKGGSCVAIT